MRDNDHISKKAFNLRPESFRRILTQTRGLMRDSNYDKYEVLNDIVMPKEHRAL